MLKPVIGAILGGVAEDDGRVRESESRQNPSCLALITVGEEEKSSNTFNECRNEHETNQMQIA